MEERCKQLYKEALSMLLTYKIDFKKYDKDIEESGLYIGRPKLLKRNISSKYLVLLNDIYLDKLSEKDIKYLENIDVVDLQTLKMVSRTYKDVLKEKDFESKMYPPAIPEHNVKNGSIVLEFVIGKNTLKISDDNYIDIMEKQDKYIDGIIEKIKEEVEKIFDVNCEIFKTKGL